MLSSRSLSVGRNRKSLLEEKLAGRKKETGKTPQEHIQAKIIDLAKESLAGTDNTINEIAYQLGFQYSQHFNRYFKRNVGKTPSQFRKEMALL